MNLTQPLLLALATAALALSSCSSEPSDWRPDEKVSTDMVEPGTRDTDNFDHVLPSGSVENQESQVAQEAAARFHGAASAHGTATTQAAHGTEAAHAPSAESTISANAEEGLRKRGKLDDAGKSSQEATTAEGHEAQH